ncbi:RDD family protein [Pacificimonas sp. WHA3]|uniref:RDD family protein n=2 Tax=Pacificimonas pallii TaxID=2827236 RepID=A0ABS6SDF3_9SPHN|nr:RDD family protein [Pacificimonas pallii]
MFPWERVPTLERTLVTPEGVPLTIRLATAGTRTSAFILDLVFMGVILILMTIILTILGFAAGSEFVLRMLFILWLLGAFILRIFYFTLFELRTRAATPGKRKNNIRVAARNGGRLTADAIVARNLFREIEVFLPLAFLSTALSEGTLSTATGFAGLGWTSIMLFFPLFNRDRLRVGDFLAGTWVIEQPQQELGFALSARDAGDQYDFTEEELAIYGERELMTLEYVLRRSEPDEEATVAAAIRTKMGREPAHDDRAFLNAYYAALRTRLESGMRFGRRRASKDSDEVRPDHGPLMR